MTYRVLFLLGLISLPAFSNPYFHARRPTPQEVAATIERAVVSGEVPTVAQVQRELIDYSQAFSQRALVAMLHRLDGILRSQAFDGAAFLDKVIGGILEKQVGVPSSQFRLFLPIFRAAADETKPGDYSKLAGLITSRLGKMAKQTPEIKALWRLGDSVVSLIKPTERAQKRIKRNLDTFAAAFHALGDRNVDGKGVQLLAKAIGHSLATFGEELFRDFLELFNPKRLKDDLVALGILANAGLNHTPTQSLVRDILNRELGRTLPQNPRELANRLAEESLAVVDGLEAAGTIGAGQAWVLRSEMDRVARGHAVIAGILQGTIDPRSTDWESVISRNEVRVLAAQLDRNTFESVDRALGAVATVQPSFYRPAESPIFAPPPPPYGPSGFTPYPNNTAQSGQRTYR